MNIDLKCLKETIVEEKVSSIPSRTVLVLLNHIDKLEEELKWRRGVHHLTGEVDELKGRINDWKAALKLVSDHRDQALDALTVTQEEWLLRVKSLEVENYNLRQKLETK